MKITLVTETFPPEVNGVAMTLKRLVEGTAALGEEFTVIRPRQAADAGAAPRTASFAEWLVPGFPLPRYQGLMMGMPVESRLLKRWEAARPAVVHVATEGPLGWSALAAALKLGIPVSTSFHTNFHQYGKHYGYGALIDVAVAYLRSFHNAAAITMVPTRQMRDELAAEGFHNIDVISRGVDAALFSPARRSLELRRSWGVSGGEPVFLYVGRLAREKNIRVAVESFLNVRATLPDARFVLVGDGPERAGLERAHPEFHFAGMRRGEDLAAHYASGDVFIFPSVTETFGNVVTEALASGLVTVTYDYAAGREHILDGVNGVLARFDHAPSFHAAVVCAAANVAGWPAMRAAARETALKVTWDSIFRRFRDALHRVAAGENGRTVL